MKTKLAQMRKFLPVLVLVGLLAGAAALAFPSGSVFAQGAQPPATPTTSAPAQTGSQAQQQAARLEKLYQNEQKLLSAQEKRFTSADNQIKKAEDKIAQLKSQGKDVTALDQALNDFKTEVQAAKSAHAAAAAILNTHAGFDANGKVTDTQLARSTVQEAGQQLRDVRQDLRPAARDLLRAIRNYIRDNRKK